MKNYTEDNIKTIYDQAIAYIEGILTKEADCGLIKHESIANIVTEVVSTILKNNKFSALSDTHILNTTIIENISTYILAFDPILETTPEIYNTRNTLYNVCVMKVMGYEVNDISEYLNQPKEEIEYAISIIESNKIIEWM